MRANKIASIVCISHKLTSQFIGPQAMYNMLMDFNEINLVFNCGEYPGTALNACDIGFKNIIFDGKIEVVNQIKNIYGYVGVLSMNDFINLGVTFFDIAENGYHTIQDWYDNEYQKYINYRNCLSTKLK